MESRAPDAHTMETELPSSKALLRIVIVPGDEGEPTRWERSHRRWSNCLKLLRTDLIRRPRHRMDQTPGATKER
jgi:hypothetical protein